MKTRINAGILVGVDGKISVRHHLPGTGPSGASHKWCRTLFFRPLLTNGILAALIAAVGCTRETPEPPPNSDPVTAPAVDDEAHSHADAPHGGTIADWGGGVYHVEFTVDHDAKSTAVYILGEDAETVAPIEADTLLLTIDEPAFQIELTPDPQAGDPEGAASRFVGQHENLGIVREFSGTISGDVEGTPYAGDFEEIAGGHDHPH